MAPIYPIALVREVMAERLPHLMGIASTIAITIKRDGINLNLSRKDEADGRTGTR
jgi:hypothetical protein